jgi:hypothetical protein
LAVGVRRYRAYVQQRLPQGFIEDDRRPEQSGHGLLGHVVIGRAEAAGSQHRAGAAERGPNRLADVVRPIRHAGAPREPDALRRQGAPDLRTVGVEREPEQQLGADGDDFEFHEAAGEAQRPRWENRLRCRIR